MCTPVRTFCWLQSSTNRGPAARCQIQLCHTIRFYRGAYTADRAKGSADIENLSFCINSECTDDRWRSSDVAECGEGRPGARTWIPDSKAAHACAGRSPELIAGYDDTAVG